MTNDELLDIFKQNAGESFMAGLRGIFDAGYCAGAGITPTANGTDFSKFQTKPAAVVKTKHGGGG